MAKLRPPGPNATPQELDAYRAKIRAMIDGDESDLTAAPEAKYENDPYIKAQLAALHRMVTASIDPETGKPTKQGVIEFLFETMNDSAVPRDVRLKAASTLIAYFHKKVPSSLMLTQQTNLADVDLSSLSEEELDQVQRLIDKATLGPINAVPVTVAKHTEH
jgi:hypothetical protein